MKPCTPESVLTREIKRLARFKTANGLARYFKSIGIKGDKEEAESCPISNYLTAKVGKRVRVANEITLDGDTYGIPSAASTFISKFDEGGYPDLDNDPNLED